MGYAACFRRSPSALILALIVNSPAPLQALPLKHFSAPVDWCIWHYDRRPCPIAEISARIGDTKVSRHRQHSTSRRCS
jgi:hypothetical protein